LLAEADCQARATPQQFGIVDAMAKKAIFKPALDGGVQLVGRLRPKSASTRRVKSLALKV
jgi:hypothetical protein